MNRSLFLLVPLSLAALGLASCKGDDDGKSATPNPEDPVPLTAGAPNAGMADAFLDLPVGTPMGGYTERCECFGGNVIRQEDLDNRDSAYTLSFVPSAGIQTRPHAAALWLDNGDQAIVMVKTDASSFEKRSVTKMRTTSPTHVTSSRRKAVLFAPSLLPIPMNIPMCVEATRDSGHDNAVKNRSQMDSRMECAASM